MILVADGWKRCPKCRCYMPRTRRYFVTVRRGRGYLYKHCRVCDQERQRRIRDEIRNDPARAARYATKHRTAQNRRYAQNPGLKSQEQRRWRERLIETDYEHYVDIVLVPRRFRREQRRTLVQGNGTYRPLANAWDTVPAGPLVSLLHDLFNGWSSDELAVALDGAVSERGIRRLLNDGQPVVALDFADRVLTRGLGRPDLLNALYPLEES